MDRPPTLSSRPARAMRPRTRSLRGHISTLIFQPATFFNELAAAEPTRHWFWIGALILGLSGFAAIQHQALMLNDPFASAPPPTSDTWTTALLAASAIVVSWLVQAVLLCEVSLFNGKSPQFGLNMRVAIWASLPLALMALLQLVYYASGTATRFGAGISGIVTAQPFFLELPTFGQAVVQTFASQLTFFWLWNLVLLYLGGRHALNGKFFPVLLVIVAWVLLVVLIPALAMEQ